MTLPHEDCRLARLAPVTTEEIDVGPSAVIDMARRHSLS